MKALQRCGDVYYELADAGVTTRLACEQQRRSALLEKGQHQRETDGHASEDDRQNFPG